MLPDCARTGTVTGAAEPVSLKRVWKGCIPGASVPGVYPSHPPAPVTARVHTPLQIHNWLSVAGGIERANTHQVGACEGGGGGQAGGGERELHAVVAVKRRHVKLKELALEDGDVRVIVHVVRARHRRRRGRAVLQLQHVRRLQEKFKGSAVNSQARGEISLLGVHNKYFIIRYYICIY
eukprot:4677645-Pyramimonas_sp.AAC.1